MTLDTWCDVSFLLFKRGAVASLLFLEGSVATAPPARRGQVLLWDNTQGGSANVMAKPPKERLLELRTPKLCFPIADNDETFVQLL